MGVLRRIRRGPRATRAVAATGLAVLAMGTVVACEPGDLSSATAAYTTDRTVTTELERRHVDVNWLTCTGNYGDKAYTPGRTPDPSRTAVVSIDCRGETKDGRKITVTGKVTRAVEGACVRGDLTAEVGGKRVFRVDGLGDCDATPAPAYSPPVTHRPSDDGRPGPTVTVTRTIWCDAYPSCRPVQGK